MMNGEVVGVVGAGVIGSGVAHVFAGAGKRVVLVDRDRDALDRGLREIHRMQRLQTILGERSKPQASAEVVPTTQIEDLAPAAFVVENVTESWAEKSAVHRSIASVCRAQPVIAANTSCIPITRLAALAREPSRVLGIHFMNPVPLVDTVEVIRAFHTSDETIEQALALLDQIGKRGIVVGDGPGFVSNRILMLTVNEAIFVLQEGIAEAAEIDEIFRSCFGHKMGPLETADLIGLDTILLSLERLHDDLLDSKFRPSPLLRRLVDAGLLGRKSGRGFYAYGNGMGAPKHREGAGTMTQERLAQ